MIAQLRGVIDAYGPDFVILDVHGVGYLVHCSGQTLQALPRKGEAATIAVETQMREDAIRLYGFATETEREWFRLLVTVQGVGSRVALAILGTLKARDLASAIALGDKGMIARAPGVGAKLAARICAELKDKGPAYAEVDPALARLAGEVRDGGAPAAASDAVSALVNLGYAPTQASAAVAAAMREAGDGAEAARLIRLGLKELAR
jgi:Holliday junction DNA helicase RuvA